MPVVLTRGKILDHTNSTPRPSILITGAASGIGRATARLFAARGWFVGCLDRDADALQRLEYELGTGNSLFRPVDVTDRPSLIQAIDAFGQSTGGTLDLLFNNAGIDAKGRFDAMPWERIVRIVEVNLLGGMSTIHSAIALLKATAGSLCLSTASASAIFGTANLAVYSATKHAMKGLTEALSVEFSTFGVRAADVLPGIIDTGMLPAAQKSLLPKEGMWRVLPAEAVAQTVWDAYHGDKLHWYVPAELADYDVRVTTHPETARDDRIAGRLL